MKARQEQNLIEAYEGNSINYDALSKIVKESITAKQTIINTVLNGEDTHVINMPLNHDQLVDSLSGYVVRDVINENQHYSWNLQTGTVTLRSTGHCVQIKKFFNTTGNMIHPDYKQMILDSIGKTAQLVISCNPYFLLGSSVSSNGSQIDSSCHYPSDDGDYCSGPVSYALDRHTMIFGLWNGSGLAGRQLVYFDLESRGFVTGRCYGDFTDAMSTACRSALYKLMNVPAYKKTSSGDAWVINRNCYGGYLDDGYFTVYRPEHRTVEIGLVEARCISCGDYHGNGNILCDDCQRGGYTCECCGGRVSEDDVYYSNSGYTYCPDCYCENYTRCERCDTELSNHHDTIAECDGSCYCTSCAERKGFYQCNECGEWSDEVTEYNGDIYCQNCLTAGRYCDKCGEYHEDSYFSGDDDICDDCSAAKRTEESDEV